MKTPFSESTYRSQVLRLRQLAEQTLPKYPVKVRELNFIHHGENTTFNVHATDGSKYLLRIHRNGYHTTEAIREELKWLEHLAQNDLIVPAPLKSKNGSLVESGFTDDVGERNCTVFRWIDGRFVDKVVTPAQMFSVGQLIAELQSHVPSWKVKHRNYWDAEGLVGQYPKFGSINKLRTATPKQQARINEVRKMLFSELRKYEKKFPHRQSLIHADVHFGNILKSKGRLGVIDFDDSGSGFHVYDVVIPIIAAAAILKDKAEKLIPSYKEAFLNGYTTKAQWGDDEEKIFPYFYMARRLLMVGWLNSRSDNPRLAKMLEFSIQRAINESKKFKGLF